MGSSPPADKQDYPSVTALKQWIVVETTVKFNSSFNHTIYNHIYLTTEYLSGFKLPKKHQC